MACRKTFPPLYAIVNADSEFAFELVRDLLHTRIELLQLRGKTLRESELEEFTKKVLSARETLRESKSPRIIVNDSPRVCLAAGADGVHLGQEDEPPDQARSLLGPDAFIGLSTHTLAQLEASPYHILNYLAFGPVFESSSKSGHAKVVGLTTLAQAAELSPLPLVAIGGITTERAAAVYSAGAASIAVISDLTQAGKIREKVEEYYVLAGCE